MHKTGRQLYRLFKADSTGSYEPIADNNTERGRAQNRRIEIFPAERSAAR